MVVGDCWRKVISGLVAGLPRYGEVQSLGPVGRNQSMDQDRAAVDH